MAGKRRTALGRAGWFAILTTAVVLATGTGAAGAAPVSGASDTTDNPAAGSYCANGPHAGMTGNDSSTLPATNCNLYPAKTDVWINGGPQNGTSQLSDGYWFFAVLSPGGQNSANDGAADNLSDGSGGDAALNRVYHVTGGQIDANLGSHTTETAYAAGGLGDLIALAPFDDTTNPGGVYILATCFIGDTPTAPDSVPTVSAKDCKYDAFKVVASCSSDCGGGGFTDLAATKTAVPALTRTYGWDIGKGADTQEIDSASGTGTFTYTVTLTSTGSTEGDWTASGAVTVFNLNPFAVSGVTLTDTIHAGTTSQDPADAHATCAITDTNAGVGETVPASGSAQFPYTCTYSGAPQATDELNVAGISWGADASTGQTAGSTSATFGFSWDDATATVADGTVAVTDPNAPGGTLGTVSYDDPPTDPKVPGVWTFTYQKTWPESGSVTGGTCDTFPNEATFTTNTSGTTGSAGADVKVCHTLDLTVTKTATPAFTRTYAWSIRKAVDKTIVKQVGGTATFNYTVTAAETGFTDSGWQVTGTITVTNPNDFEAITANVTDSIDNGGTCSVTGGSNVSVPAGGNTGPLAYTCTYTSAPSPAGFTNTATAQWDSTVANTPTGSASGTATGTFTTPTSTVHKTITVTDSYAGTLGTVTATDSTPYASRAFTYSRTISVPSFDCLTYPNTATITETGQTAGQSVQVCGPAHTGALTMGFWQNKNGQGIIAGQAKTGTCPSATWLRQFAPFQDLSSTATCSQTATYVYNVVKAANAAGAAMNAMLKAQMLATALDVYFSDAALGGNKIGAAAPIGGVAVDLSKVCNMIDGSGGTATCSGSYSNTSSAFGGAACPTSTVMSLLVYAAGQSNAGGTTWYGQVKATQGLAKNTFDAINNQVAFRC